MYEVGGRPPALDERALSQLLSFSSSLTDGLSPSREEIVMKIKSLYIETWSRRFKIPNGRIEPVKKPPKLSRRTTLRYLGRLGLL